MIVVSPRPKASTATEANPSRIRPSRSQGSVIATDQQSSQLVSANVAGFRSETGPVTAPPVVTRAATWSTIVASNSQPASHSTPGQPVRPPASLPRDRVMSPPVRSAAVGDRDDPEDVPVRVVPVEPAAAVAVVDPTGLLVERVGPERQVAFLDACLDLVELLLGDHE